MSIDQQQLDHVREGLTALLEQGLLSDAKVMTTWEHPIDGDIYAVVSDPFRLCEVGIMRKTADAEGGVIWDKKDALGNAELARLFYICEKYVRSVYALHKNAGHPNENWLIDDISSLTTQMRQAWHVFQGGRGSYRKDDPLDVPELQPDPRA